MYTLMCIRISPCRCSTVELMVSWVTANRDSEDVFEVNEYIDSDLVYLANEGQIISISDSGNDAELEE